MTEEKTSAEGADASEENGLGSKEFWLKSWNDKYVSGGKVDLESSDQNGEHEKHSLVHLEHDLFAIRTQDGRFWSCHSNLISTKIRLSESTLTKEALDNSHKFNIVPLGLNKVAIRAHVDSKDVYLCTERSGRIVINRKKIQQFERFTTNLLDDKFLNDAHPRVIDELYADGGSESPLADSESESGEGETDELGVGPGRPTFSLSRASLSRQSTFHLVKTPSFVKETGSIFVGFLEKKGDAIYWELWSKSANGTHVVTEVRCESERYAATQWKPPFLLGDPPNFTDITRNTEWFDLQTPPEFSFVGSDDWKADMSDETDPEGWKYGGKFGSWDSLSPKCSTWSMTRVRKLIRTRIRASKRIAKDLDFEIESGVHAKGTSLVHLIQQGIKIANLKDRRPNDHHARYYFQLKNSEGQPYEFQDYAPHTFGKIREQYGINDDEYVRAMCDNLFRGGDTEDSGKSGSIFWRSHDNLFVVKTITFAEAEFLTHILRDYETHLQQNKHTLISRFFGLHKIKAYGKRLRFVVMNNVFHADIPIQLIFDLKGTTEDRLVHQDSTMTDQPVLKDLNFTNRTMIVSSQMMDALLTQINKDTEFLTRVDVMDYSLLLGIASCEKDEERKEIADLDSELRRVKDSDLTSKSVFEVGIDGLLSERFYVGIIDILQDWTTVKKMAHVVKTVRYTPRGITIDSVPPEPYAKRFCDHFKEKILDKERASSNDFALSVIVKSAKSLKSCDTFSKSSDPYVSISFMTYISVTQVVKKNLNPVWNHLCIFKFDYKDEYSEQVKFVCHDWDRGKAPDLIGECTLNISECFERSAFPVDKTVRLVNPENPEEDVGVLDVTVELTDNRSQERKSKDAEFANDVLKIGDLGFS